MNRLPPPFGSRIDRAQRLHFSFEGRKLEGFAGDTIASALAASGEWQVSRSFKYHRPRGLHSLTGSDANALVQVGDEPNVDAGLTPLRDGMVVSAQNVNGSLAHDRDSVIDKLGRFLPVGFYYRTFMGPTHNAWLKLWEPLIRRKAGLGRLHMTASHPHGDTVHLHCDVLVVGCGPAGLAAGIEAARSGADVILCEAEPELSGSLTFAAEQHGLASLVAEAQSLPGLRLMTGTVCNGWFEDNWLPLIRGNTLHRVRARRVIFATGVLEQPAVFRNNDLPGLMAAGTVRRLVRHYGVKTGTTAVVLAAGDETLDTVRALQEAGVQIAAVVAPQPLSATCMDELRREGLPVIDGRIEEARGNKRLSALRVGGRWIDCDVAAITAGYMPSWQLPCQAGARLVCGDDGEMSFTGFPPDVDIAGGITGHSAHEAVLADGRRAAQAALRALGLAAREEISRPSPASKPFRFWDAPGEPDPRGRDFVDFDEDLQVKDLVHAVQEGYREIELVKRFTTVGMGPSQGRHSAKAAALIVARSTARRLSQTGVTTARPPAGPEKLSVLAGHHTVTERRTALHAAHVQLGAEMRPVGNWWRPYVYRTGAPREEAIAAEVKAVREGVGLLDVSTLGKLEVRGPDAGAFLDRMYATNHGNQSIGRVRYALMLNEMGSVMDDGVVLRLTEDTFYVTATTGAVARVYADMSFWNAQWRMNVDVLNLTGAFCGLNLTGPKARAVLSGLSSDISFEPEAFPYLQGKSATIAGVPVRAMRIGFTGELSYELHCAGSQAMTLYKAIAQAGPAHDLKPYGLEASRILRLEKGHILIGQDTDAMSTPDELGFGWAVSKRKAFFVGKRSLEARRRTGLQRKLAGLTFAASLGPNDMGEGCLVLRNGEVAGHVTSFATSPTLGKPIALAHVHTDDAKPGATVSLRARNGATIAATVAGHAFFDPQNLRQEI